MAELVDDKIGMNDVLSSLNNDEDEQLDVPDESESPEESKPEEEIKEPPSDDEPIKLEDEKSPDEYIEVPARKTILKKYPEFFKDFPGVEKSIYREQKYTEIFGTIKDAQNAREALQDFGRIENELSQGKISGVFDALKRNNPKAFQRTVGTLLSQLAEVDKDAYYGNVNTVLKTAISQSYKAGKEANNEDGEQLMLAAQLLHRFIYGTPNISEFKMDVPEQGNNDPRAQELANRERSFAQQQLGSAVNDVTDRIGKTVRNWTEQNIDPRGVMPKYMRDKAVEDVISACDRAISSDRRFVQYRDELWKEAIKNNYSSQDRDRIREAVTRKAKSILPDIIKKVRAEAMNGLGGRKQKVSESKSEEFLGKSSDSNRRQTPPSKKSEQPRKLNSTRDVMKALEEM